MRRSFQRKLISLGDVAYSDYLSSIPGTVWWHGQELGGTDIISSNPGFNGTYSNVILGGVATNQLGYAPAYNGTTSYGNVYSSSLNTFFDGDVGAMMAIVKMNAGVWEDGGYRCVMRLLVDGDDYIDIVKNTTNNQLLFRRRGSASVEFVTTSISTYDWFAAILTWDINAGASGEVKAYIDGTQSSTTQTALGALVGNLSATDAVIGASITTPTLIHNGSICHVGISNWCWQPGLISEIQQKSGI